MIFCVGIPMDKVNTQNTLFNQKQSLVELTITYCSFYCGKKTTNDYNKKEGKYTWQYVCCTVEFIVVCLKRLVNDLSINHRERKVASPDSFPLTNAFNIAY